jgi:putative ABC transport system permease protein
MSTQAIFHDAQALPRSWWRAIFHPWIWKMAWRDSRAQRRRLALFTLSIVAGMSALVAIHALKATVQTGVDAQAKALLGSDLHIASRQPIPAEVAERVAAFARRFSQETSFSSMLSFPTPGAARLVQVRGLQGEFPFYGKLETMPPDAWTRLMAEGGIVLEPALLEQFGAKIGDRVKLGDLELSIVGAMPKPPPRSSRYGGFAPEVFVRLADLDRTGLLGTRSFASYDLHLELARPELARRIRRAFNDQPWRFETPENRREALENALENLQDYLGVVALVALVLGAVGVAGAIHAHVSRRVGTVATLRCLGCPGDAAFSIYLAQALTLGLAGAIIGAALGATLHVAAVYFLRDALPVAVALTPSARVLAETTGAGFAVCAGFALLPLLRIRGIAPSAALREGLDAGNARRAWPIYLLLGAALIALSLLPSEHRLRTLVMNGALGAAFLLLAGTAYALMALARRVMRPGWPYLLRQGISNLYRPRNQTLLFLLSLGLGTFLLLTILLTRGLLLEKVSLAPLEQSPNIYLIDVQPDQREGVGAVVKSLGYPVLESAPLVTMRIQEVRGRPVRELEKEGAVPKWILRREFRSTYRSALNPTETIVAGEWLPAVTDPNGPVPLSLEKEIAKDLRVALGDELVLDVQGVPIRARITSLREIDWSRFNLNFFMVFPPGVLEDAPGSHVLTTRLPEGVSSGLLQRNLVQQFPNVTAIDLTLILETVRSVLAKITRAISVVAAFTVLAGLPILIGALLNGREQRVRESVLLRTLGASARQVRAILVIEYAALGLLSALAAVILAVVANWALAVYLFNASPWPSATLVASAFCATTLLSVLGGMALSRGITRQPPLEILRRVG